MESVQELKNRLAKLDIGESIEIADVVYERVSGGVEIDSDFVALEDLEEHLDLLFHYEAQDCKDEY